MAVLSCMITIDKQVNTIINVQVYKHVNYRLYLAEI